MDKAVVRGCIDRSSGQAGRPDARVWRESLSQACMNVCRLAFISARKFFEALCTTQARNIRVHQAYTALWVKLTAVRYVVDTYIDLCTLLLLLLLLLLDSSRRTDIQEMRAEVNGYQKLYSKIFFSTFFVNSRSYALVKYPQRYTGTW